MVETSNIPKGTKEPGDDLFASLDAMFHANLPQIRRIVSTHVRASDVEDAIGDVRLAIASKLMATGQLPTSQYFLRMVKFAAIDVWRKSTRAPLTTELSEDMASPDDAAELIISDIVVNQISREVIRRLDKTDAQIYALSILLGLTSTQVSKHVGLSAPNVRARLVRKIYPKLKDVAAEIGYKLE